MTPQASLPLFQHERVTTIVGPRSGAQITVALHSSALGPALGGARLWRYPAWIDGVADALRLSAAMTLKNATAGLDAGGGKAVIALAPDETLDAERRRAALLDLGELVASFGGSYRTAEDVGTTEHDMLVVREQTEHVVGLPAEHGGSGEPADATAAGVHASVRATLAESTGSPDPAGRTIVISGLGQVGSRLARRLAGEGATLVVTDVVPAKRGLADELGATWIEPEAAVSTPGDLFVPAGLGGILTDSAIDGLDVRAVVGPANNPLADRTGARRLADRGILYAPDFVVSAGGVIHLILSADGADDGEIRERVAGIGSTLAGVFATARAEGVTTLEAAERLAARRLDAAS